MNNSVLCRNTRVSSIMGKPTTPFLFVFTLGTFCNYLNAGLNLGQMSENKTD